MPINLPDIQQKIVAIQHGLLQYKHNDKKMSLRVKIAIDEKNTLNCIVTDDRPSQKLLNKNVTLIQKDRENYLYIGGRISRQAAGNLLIFSVDIKKACWFIRKSKGSMTWLQEKCVYLPQMQLAS